MLVRVAPVAPVPHLQIAGAVTKKASGWAAAKAVSWSALRVSYRSEKKQQRLLPRDRMQISSRLATHAHRCPRGDGVRAASGLSNDTACSSDLLEAASASLPGDASGSEASGSLHGGEAVWMFP